MTINAGLFLLSVFLLFGVFLGAGFANFAFFLGGDAAAMCAFLAVSFGLFATRRELLVLRFCVLVVRAECSRASEQCQCASGHAQEFDEFHKFCG
jgi:hypothetical protein